MNKPAIFNKGNKMNNILRRVPVGIRYACMMDCIAALFPKHYSLTRHELSRITTYIVQQSRPTLHCVVCCTLNTRVSRAMQNNICNSVQTAGISKLMHPGSAVSLENYFKNKLLILNFQKLRRNRLQIASCCSCIK